MNKLLYVFVCLLSVNAAIAADGISEKILQIFKQTFPKAEEVVWVEQPDKVRVDFKDGGIATKVEYDMDGNFLSSVRYYTEKNLPVNILCKLQKKFPGKTVFGVTEMTTGSDVEYYIKLEDATTWITVKSSENGSMEVVEKYKKS
jgi:Putative beta-lactamase-inhibitor-like, PepSY-like